MLKRFVNADLYLFFEKRTLTHEQMFYRMYLAEYIERAEAV